MANTEDGTADRRADDMSSRTEPARAIGTMPSPGRLNGTGPIAVVDIGSNSVRLVVYERLVRSATPLFNEKELCGLARGIETTGKLDQEAIASALGSIRRFRALSTQLGVKDIHVLATAAARDASNGPEFVKAVESITGVSVDLLSGTEEARLTALGVISGIHDPNGIAGDLGGGSLEVIDVHGTELGTGETFPVGGLRLEEGSQKSIKKAEKIVAEALAKSKVLPGGENRPFYAIGGTWRSLARLHMRQKGYPLHVMHQYSIKATEASEFCRMIARRDVDSLDSIEVVSRNRRPLLAYGAVVLDQVIRVMRPSEIVLSALGVREGHLYDMLPPEEKAQDPLIAACEELAWLRARSPAHARELPAWSAMVFAALGLDETEEEARLRHAACLLTDIGWRAHPEYRGVQSLNLIAHATFIGVDHPGRAYLALTNFYRHEGLIDEGLSPQIRELASTRYMERARALGATLRISHLISAGMPGAIGRVRVEQRGKLLALILPEDLAPLGGSRVERRLSQLAKFAGLEAAILVD